MSLFTSIGKKYIMSISGLFLILFLSVHLFTNLLMIIDTTGVLYNKAAHFMGTNTIVRIVEPVLALGMVIHIVIGVILAIRNLRSRPVGYAYGKIRKDAIWPARNMLLLGILIFGGLGLHLYDFWYKMRIAGDPSLAPIVLDGVTMDNAFALVSGFFKSSIYYNVAYILWFVVLGAHLSHGFWSAFQTIGLSNEKWHMRLKVISYLVSAAFVGGFCLIPLYYLYVIFFL